MKPRILLLAILVLAAIPFNTLAQIQWELHPIELDEEIKDRVRFGYLAVPENRNNPDSREIFMAFTVIESYNENSLPDPVIILPGGPGIGPNQFVNDIAGGNFAQQVLKNRDLVLIDIRGSGYSHPRLCENLDTEEFRLATTFTAGQALHELEEAAIAECAEKIREAGAEITFYNAVEVAHDFEALRLALGYNQWNIRGLSYGTRHTMTQIQQYPQTVRSAILIGMYPLKNYYDRIPVYLSRSLRILFEYCENDADCSEAFPDPEAELIEVLQRIDNNPIPLPAFLQRKIGEGDHFITSSMIFGGVFNLLYQKNGIEILPILIHQLAQGNDWIVQNMSLAMANTWAAISTDINFILRNNDEEEDPSFLYPGEWDNLALQLNEFYWGNNSETSLNRFWPELRGSQMAPTEVWEVSGVPVLLISGELDPVTPPSNGDKFAEYFTNYAHHIIPGSGHYPHADADINFAAFFDDPDPVRFDIHSHMEVQPLQLVTDVRVNRGISTTLALVGAGMYQRMILPGIAILLCLFGLIYFPVRFLVRKIRSKTYEGLFKQKLTVWLASFLNLVVVVLYALAIMDALNTNPYILAIGLPAKWIFIRAVIVVLAIILVVGLVNMKSIWKSKVRVKIPSVLSLLGGIGFTLFVFLSGMF